MLREYRQMPENQLTASSSTSSIDSIPSFMPQDQSVNNSVGYVNTNEESETQQEIGFSSKESIQRVISTKDVKHRRYTFEFEFSAADAAKDKSLICKTIKNDAIIQYDAGTGVKGGIVEQAMVLGCTISMVSNGHSFSVDVTSKALGCGNAYDVDTGARMLTRIPAGYTKMFGQGKALDVYRHSVQLYSEKVQTYAGMTAKDLEFDPIDTILNGKRVRAYVIPQESYVGDVIKCTADQHCLEENKSVVIISGGAKVPVMTDVSRHAILTVMPAADGQGVVSVYLVPEAVYQGAKAALQSEILDNNPLINLRDLDICLTRGGSSWNSHRGLLKYKKQAGLIQDILKTPKTVLVTVDIEYKLPGCR